jgi:hypothetical protein
MGLGIVVGSSLGNPGAGIAAAIVVLFFIARAWNRRLRGGETTNGTSEASVGRPPDTAE